LGWLAVIGPFCALGSIAVSISLSPWFDWQNNAVSDLGVHDVAPIFNVSLIICGALCATFALGTILRLKSPIGKTGMTLMFLASISLAGIGVFNEDWSPHHFYFSVAFFVLLLISTLILGPLFLLKRRTRLLGAAAVAVTCLGVFGWAYPAAVGWGAGVAIPEALTFVPGGLWFAMVGQWSLRGAKK
jgi:hypothetical membrane protein